MRATNRLLDRLPGADRARLLEVARPAVLVLGTVLGEADAITRHVYFPTEGYVSLITPVDAHPGLEVGMVGREGMLGGALVLGAARAPWRSLVQGAGSAWRVGAPAFRRAVADSDPLRRLLQRYCFVLLSQLATANGCMRFHQIGPRLARWLLMTQDRAQADRFDMTHAFLALMLGVRRVGITEAAGDLQRRGLIDYTRGRLQVLDRAGLEAAACSCYARDGRSHRLHLGS